MQGAWLLYLQLGKMENKIVNYVAWSFVVILVVGLFFYFRVTPASEPIDVSGNVIFEAEVVDAENEVFREESEPTRKWIDFELKDVITQEVFRLSDFDKPIVLESFAVWCPTCKKQQDQIQKLIDAGDDSIHVSINTDPNEDEARVAQHVNRYSYTWSFVVFPAAATQLLINDFGSGVVNAPRAPIILICPDMTARLLESGVKSAEELKEEIDKC